MTSVPSHVTPLKLVQHASLNLAACPPAALVDPGWLGTPVASATTGTRRYLTDLSLPVRDRSPQLTFKKAAYVDMGEARSTADGCELEISWQSSSLAPLFPVFAGRLKGPSTARAQKLVRRQRPIDRPPARRELERRSMCPSPRQEPTPSPAGRGRPRSCSLI